MSSARYVPVQQAEGEDLELQPVHLPADTPFWDPQYATGAVHNASLPALPPRVSSAPLPETPTAPQLLPAPVAVPDPYQRPSGVVIPPVPTIAELKQRIFSRHVNFDSMKYFNDAWDLVKQNFCRLFSFMILCVLFSAALSIAAIHSFALCGQPGVDSDGACLLLVQMGLPIFDQIFITGPLVAGAYIAVFTAMRTDGNIKFKHFFHGYKLEYFPRLAVLGLVLLVARALLLMWVIPGVYFAIATTFSVPLFVEHKTRVCDSIRLSMTVVNRYFCNFLGFILLAVFLQLAGLMVLGVGVLFTLPTAFVAFAFCYHHLVGVNSCPLEPAIEAASVLTAPALPPVQYQQMYPAPVPQPQALPVAPAPVIPSPAPSAPSLAPYPQALPGYPPQQLPYTLVYPSLPLSAPAGAHPPPPAFAPQYFSYSPVPLPVQVPSGYQHAQPGYPAYAANNQA